MIIEGSYLLGDRWDGNTEYTLPVRLAKHKSDNIITHQALKPPLDIIHLAVFTVSST